ncbi:MAG: hypothetical protein E7549_00725 [Ruminococcaceae bacterium]|nr:hypothetical protein [Oscillospiraceae bacterium]
MKKHAVLVLVCLLTFLTACQPMVDPEPPTGDTTTTTTTTTVAQPVAKPKYDAVGTGMEKPADFTPDVISYRVTISWGERVSGLLNTALQDEINAFIEEYETETHLSEVWVLNGYMSVEVGGEFALYDLYEGKRIEFSDLFFKGVEFVPTLNRCIQKAIQEAVVLSEDIAPYGSEINPEAFTGLKEGHTAFYLDRVFLPNSVYHIGQDIYAAVEGLHNDSVLSIARDMQGVFEDGMVELYFTNTTARTVNERMGETYDALTVLDADHYPETSVAAINAAVTAASEQLVAEQTMQAWYEKLTGKDDFMMLAGYGGMRCSEVAGRYFRFDVMRQIGPMGDVPYGMLMYFDRETGEEVPYHHFFKDGWDMAATWYISAVEGYYYFGEHSEEGKLAEKPNLQNAAPMFFTVEKDGYVLNLALPNGNEPLVTAVIPFEYVDWSR